VDVEAAASLISYGGRQVICDVIRDITERKKVEEALRQSEQLYRTVIEQATEYISLVDVESKRIVGSNSAFREALGYTEEELKNMTLYDIVAHDRESIDTNVRQALERGRYLVGERKHRRKHGSLVDVEVSASTILHEGREVFCVVGHDVTERVEAHRMLERRVAALAGIAASLTVDRPMETTLHALAAGIVESTAAVACSVVLIDPQTSMIRLAGSHGLPEGYTGAMQASWQAGIHGRMVRVFRSQRPSLVHDARRVLLDNPLYAPIHPLVREVRWDVVYIVPLVVRGEALGATRRYPMHRAAMPQPRGLRGGGSRWPPSICTPPIPESFSHKHRYSSPS
jgi:PAS domain S-box-containing protein